MIHSFGDPNDLFTTIKDFSKKTKRKTSKTADSEDKNSEIRASSKSLENSEAPEPVSIGQDVNGDKPKVQEKEEKKHSGYERKSFKTLRFRMKNRKKSKTEEEAGKIYDGGKDEQACSDAEKITARGSSSSSDQERMSSSAAGELALKILQEINGPGIMRGFDRSETNLINDQVEFNDHEILPNHEDTNEGFLLRRSKIPFEENSEVQKRRKTRSVTEEYSASTPEELSLTPGEIIQVVEKRFETWYLGEKADDKEKGWFPAECAVEITPGSVKHVSKEIRTSDEKYVVVLEGFYSQRESYA